jgi:hypothetical protein
MLKSKNKRKTVKTKSITRLNSDLARAIMNMVLEGETFFNGKTSNKGSVDVILDTGKTQKVARNTIDAWIKRGTIIPGTDVSFRDLWFETRNRRKEIVREERREQMLDESEKVLQKTLSVETNLPVRNIFGQTMVENGEIVKKENHNLLRIKTDTAKFVAERLNSQYYGNKVETNNRHLVFSLAELRKMKEEENA